MNTVLSLYPRLKHDNRITLEIVRQILDLFDTETEAESVIDYDAVLNRIMSTLRLPKDSVEPFVETYAQAYCAVGTKTVVRICKSCTERHSMMEMLCCAGESCMIVKSIVGYHLIDRDDRQERFVN